MFLACFSSRLLFLWPEDITCASRGKASPVRRQICGDREHLQRLIPQPGACCHLTVSHCFDLTFAFCHLSSKSSPQLCCCRFKLCIRKDMQSLQMIADKEYYSKARMKPLASQYIYMSLNCPSCAVGQTLDSAKNVMQPCSQRKTLSLMSSRRPGQVLLLESWGQRRSVVSWDGGLT